MSIKFKLDHVTSTNIRLKKTSSKSVHPVKSYEAHSKNTIEGSIEPPPFFKSVKSQEIIIDYGVTGKHLLQD